MTKGDEVTEDLKVNNYIHNYILCLQWEHNCELSNKYYLYRQRGSRILRTKVQQLQQG